MSDTAIRVVPAAAVRTGDIFALTGRVVTQTRADEEQVTLHFGPYTRMEMDRGTPVRVRRGMRTEYVHEDPSDAGHIWYVEKRRPY